MSFRRLLLLRISLQFLELLSRDSKSTHFAVTSVNCASGGAAAYSSRGKSLHILRANWRSYSAVLYL